MSATLHLHLGPVGGFIGAARRTRDYWAGSFLLSRLAGEAMAVVEEEGGEIILPLLRAQAADDESWEDSFIKAIRKSRNHERLLDRESPLLGSLTNHFAATFSDEDHAERVAKAAANALRKRWKMIADAVRTRVLDDFRFLTAEGLDADAPRRIWDIWEMQIGGEKVSPFWEIYWVVTPGPGVVCSLAEKLGWSAAPDEGLRPLDLRKYSRLSLDAFALTPDRGNFCTMMSGLVDISGLERRVDGDLRKTFWQAVRRHLVRKRYGDRPYLDETSCLDLRENESLSAPALVKRLFPLLADVAPNELKQAVGWQPNIRSATAFAERPGVFERMFKFFALPSPPERDELGHEKADQFYPLLWPSTSYVAATHWIAKAQKYAPVPASRFARAMRKVGPHLAFAEWSLWLPAVHESAGARLLFGFIDGAMFHVNRLEREKTSKSGALKVALKELRALQDEEIGGEKLGAPPSYYAIIRVDVDHAGKALSEASGKTRDALSALLAQWSQDLRGRMECKDPERQLGVFAERNGVLLYASADEAMALAPTEDAYDIAEAIHRAFEERKSEAKRKGGVDPARIEDLTVSAAILFAHIRAPLRWAIRESTTLLDDIAKKACGRDALAIGLFDIDGLRSPWASPWQAKNKATGTTPFSAFGEVLRLAAGGGSHDFLWSNEFYHRLADALAAFVIPEKYADFRDATRYVKPSDEKTSDRTDGFERCKPNSTDKEMVKSIVAWRVAERLRSQGRPPSADREITEHLYTLMTIYFNEEGPDDGKQEWVGHGHVSLAPLDILRVIGKGWNRETAAFGPSAEKEKAA